MAEPTLLLHSAWLRNRIAELGLKQWWLAEQLAVDRKTVVRWVNGQVESIRRDNAVALAAILGCDVDQLERPRDLNELATVQDQAEAGQLLATSALLERLGPVGEWDLAESLIRAVALPGLPAHVLGELMNRLCVACWRQDKLDDAEAANRAALALAERCGDKAVRAGALASRANLLHWRGHCAAAQATYCEALALASFIEPPALAGLRCNLGASLCECGELDRGRDQLRAALAELRLVGNGMQLSIVRTHLALADLRQQRASDAALHADWSLRHAEQAGYRRGLAMCELLQAEVAALHGRFERALQHLAQGLQRFAALGIVEGLNHEIEARVLRRAGRLDDAARAAERGLQCSAAFPLQQAELWLELALVRQGNQDPGAAAYFAAARAAFEACGAAARVQQMAALSGLAAA